MNANQDALREKERIMSEAVITAYAVVAVLGRKEDEISEREAFELYGRGWIRDRINRGALHFSRNGATNRSAKIYSRFEIECLKRAEKRITDKFNDAMRAIDNANKKL